MRYDRHRFTVLHYIRLLDDMMTNDDSSHLNPFDKEHVKHTKKRTGVYKCADDKRKSVMREKCLMRRVMEK